VGHDWDKSFSLIDSRYFFFLSRSYEVLSSSLFLLRDTRDNCGNVPDLSHSISATPYFSNSAMARSISSFSTPAIFDNSRTVPVISQAFNSCIAHKDSSHTPRASADNNFNFGFLRQSPTHHFIHGFESAIMFNQKKARPRSSKVTCGAERRNLLTLFRERPYQTQRVKPIYTAST